MKITIESTDQVMTFRRGTDAYFEVREWRGTTEDGVPVLAYVATISPQTHDEAVNERFARELAGGAPRADRQPPVPGRRDVRRRPDIFGVASALTNAAGPASVATILLRLSDRLVLACADELEEECRRRDFAPGAAFIVSRAAALRAVRDAHGLLPEHLAANVEGFRRALSEFAARKRAEDTPLVGSETGELVGDADC